MKLFKDKKGHGRHYHVYLSMAILALLYYLNLRFAWVEVPSDLNLFLLAGVGIFYAMLPDCDQPGAWANKIVVTMAALVVIYSFYNLQYKFYGVVAAVLILVIRWIPHRTIIHSVLGALVFSAPLLYAGHVYFVVGVVAYLTHIISDGEFSLAWEADWN